MLVLVDIKKSGIAVKQTRFLGLIISAGVIQKHLERIKAVCSCVVVASFKGLQALRKRCVSITRQYTGTQLQRGPRKDLIGPYPRVMSATLGYDWLDIHSSQ